MSKSTPDAPDPITLAKQQGKAGVKAAQEQARLNRLNETTPLGSLTFQETGNRDVPFERITELNPTAQLTLDQQQQLGLSLSQFANQLSGRVGETVGSPLDFSQLQNPIPQVDEAARLRIEDALFGRQSTRLNQQFGDLQEQLDTRLANQGIQRGSEAFSEEQERFGRTRNDAFDIALQNAIAGGAQEQSRLFGLGSQARGIERGELLTERGNDINTLSALLNRAPVSIPNFGGVPQVGVQAPDLLGANALALNQGNLQAQLNSQFQNNLFGLGGSLGAASILGGGGAAAAGLAGPSSALAAALAPAAVVSDRRLKKNIKKIGTLRNGLDVYQFDYIWDEPSVGVMADEVKEVMPQAVVNISGYDHVNYREVLNASS